MGLQFRQGVGQGDRQPATESKTVKPENARRHWMTGAFRTALHKPEKGAPRFL